MPEKPKDLFTSANGLSLHYRDWGGSGQPIVLLHGLASTSHIWDLVAPILALEYRVVALDQRGHGESDKPEDGYDFATVLNDLHGFVANLGIERPVIAGHSWGGDVALEFTVAHPDSLAGLCFVDGGMMDLANNTGWDRETARREMAPPDFTGIEVDQFLRRVRERWSAIADNEGQEQIVMANFFVLEDGTIKARLSRENHLRIIDSVWDHHPADLYRRVTCPALLMPARQNHDGPKTSRQNRKDESVARAEKLLPTSKTVWLEDSIHDVPVQRPELVASVISSHIANGFFSA